MQHYRSLKKQNGFTIIELMVVIIILVILGTLVALTYSGVQTKNRNAERQSSINSLQGQLEAYYAQTDKYPTLASLNDANWRSKNLKNLPANALQDPKWSKSSKKCASSSRAIAAGSPTEDCYSYQVTGSDGSACDNAKINCAHYTLTAMLEGGDKYVKSSLN
ncbi:MAG TPA: type II secretion system protein [Patescibacteria group bacterium]|nr:type II secretion system protein [Patescibacteria group bacterium]